jgi:predicted transcriptional regulator
MNHFGFPLKATSNVVTISRRCPSGIDILVAGEKTESWSCNPRLREEGDFGDAREALAPSTLRLDRRTQNLSYAIQCVYDIW